MQTTVKLQGIFEYSVIPLIVAVSFAIIITVYLISRKENKDRNKLTNNTIEKIPEKNIRNIPVIKKKYLKQLDEIDKKYLNKEIELRIAYQKISEAIRMFVFEVTDIATQNYSLSEIKKLNMPVVYNLIQEYYEPEFASKTSGDFSEAINKARSVVKKWK